LVAEAGPEVLAAVPAEPGRSLLQEDNRVILAEERIRALERWKHG
jgi:hypothetical protein